MRVLFVYKLKKPAVGYSHDCYTHQAVCVGVAATVFTLPITEFQAGMIRSCLIPEPNSEQFVGYTDAEIRIMGERVLEEEGSPLFDIGEVISNAIDEIEAMREAYIEENGRNGINQADEYETIQ